MEKISVGKYTFGDGNPRIFVPVIGRTEDEIYQAANAINEEIKRLDEVYSDYPELSVSAIEWRADYFDDVADLDRLSNVLTRLREIFPDRLLLFTFRSEEQGGELRHDMVCRNLEPIMKTVIISNCVDLLDVELTCGNYKVVRATTKAHEMGLKVIMSYHDFDRTPHDSEIIQKLQDMETLGADILKIAVMPRNEFDVRRMMELNKRMSEESFKPITIISMGEKGMMSRFKGREYGSCLTFCSIGQESAPGQIEAADLIELMKHQL